MLSPDKLMAIENAMRNVACLIMAGMMEAMSGMMGDLGQALQDAFAGDNQKQNVAAEIRQRMTDEQRKLFEDLQGDAEAHSAERDRIIARLDDETADRLIAGITQQSFGLPPLTEKLQPEALLGYLHLLQGSEASGLQAAIGEFASTLQALGEPQNASELEALSAEELSNASGSPVTVTIDRGTCGEGTEVGRALSEVGSAFRQLAIGETWVKSRLAAVRQVRVRAVATVEEKSFEAREDAWDLAVCLTEDADGWFGAWDLSQALTDQWRVEVRDRAIAEWTGTAAPIGEGISLQLSGLRVIAPSTDPELRAFGTDPGVTLALTLRRPQGGITEFISEGSSITSCTDDRGTDLLGPVDPTSSGSSGFSSFPTLTADGTAALLEVSLPGLPAPGAARANIEGTCALALADGQVEHRAHVRWETGAVLVLNGIEFTVRNVSDGGWNFEVTLETHVRIGDIAGFSFLDPSGQAIECTSGGSSTNAWGDEVTEERVLRFEQAVEEGTLIGRFWSGRRQVTLPFKATVQLGL